MQGGVRSLRTDDIIGAKPRSFGQNHPYNPANLQNQNFSSSPQIPNYRNPTFVSDNIGNSNVDSLDKFQQEYKHNKAPLSYGMGGNLAIANQYMQQAGGGASYQSGGMKISDEDLYKFYGLSGNTGNQWQNNNKQDPQKFNKDYENFFRGYTPDVQSKNNYENLKKILKQQQTQQQKGPINPNQRLDMIPEANRDQLDVFFNMEAKNQPFQKISTNSYEKNMDIFMNLEDAGRITPNKNFQSPSRLPQNNYNPQQRQMFNPVAQSQNLANQAPSGLNQFPPQDVQKAMDIFFNLEKDNANVGARGMPKGYGGPSMGQQQMGYGQNNSNPIAANNGLQKFNPQEVNKAMDVFFNLEPGQVPKIRPNNQPPSKTNFGANNGGSRGVQQNPGNPLANMNPKDVQKAMDVFFNLEPGQVNNNNRGLQNQNPPRGYQQPQQSGLGGKASQEEINKAMDVFFNLEKGSAPTVSNKGRPAAQSQPQQRTPQQQGRQPTQEEVNKAMDVFFNMEGGVSKSQGGGYQAGSNIRQGQGQYGSPQQFTLQMQNRDFMTVKNMQRLPYNPLTNQPY